MKVRPFVTVEPNLRRVFTQVYDRKKIRNPPHKESVLPRTWFAFGFLVLLSKRGAAEAEIGSAGQSNAQRQSALGLVPHSLRGFLHRHQLMLPATEAFFNCTACSPLVRTKHAPTKNKTLLSHLLSCRRAVLLYIARILTSMSNFFFIETILLEMAPVICGRNCGCKTFLFRFFLISGMGNELGHKKSKPTNDRPYKLERPSTSTCFLCNKSSFAAQNPKITWQ